MRYLLVLALLPITAAGLVATAAPASAAPAVSGTVDPSHGFPLWYEDAAGTRVEPCIDPADANCVLPAAGTSPFNPGAPVVFPGNFPDEFFYTVAQSTIATPGCGTSAPGKATMTAALEGAFLGGVPNPTDRMVFGRIRLHVSSGLCAGQAYTFQHPFGTITAVASDLGGVPTTVGTEDIGCVPAPATPCDFTLATGSRVFGAAGTGFLRWDAGAPAGYLGDGVTPHAITGGTNGNLFVITDDSGATPTQSSNLFTVSGKIAGSLQASPSPVDFGGVVDGTTSAAKTVTVTNVDNAAVTLGAATFTGANAAEFADTGAGTCTVGQALTRDQTCTYVVTLSPPAAAPAGPRTATLQVASTGGVRSPLNVTLNGSAKEVGQAPLIALNAATVNFGNVRVRETSPTQHIIVTNSGNAALTVTDVLFDQATVPHYDNYRMILDTCTINGSVAPGASCTIDLQMAPIVAGAHPTGVVIRSNNAGGEITVPVTGTGFGGLAAVSTVIDPVNGFPTWYMDDQGAKLAQCLDPADPNCIVLPDPTFDPGQPVVFPSNFPGEFFYHVSTSDNISIGDATCGAGVGKAFMRSAIEGAFTGGNPVPGDQMVFGRIRFFVSGGGLCPNTDYVFSHPYGADRFTMDGAGGLRRKDATDDVGCAPTPGTVCDFTLALSSRVLGSTLRWDPAVAPAAPAGYQGDAASLHKVTGAPYSPDGTTFANYFEISRADTGEVVGKTELFTVMGKYLGPLEASPLGISFGTIPQGSTSGSVSSTITNTGINPVTISAVTQAGADAAQFTIAGGNCVAATLAPGASCTVSATVAPTVPGALAAQLLITNSSINGTVAVDLTAVGGAAGATPNVSFSPRTVAFGTLHDGRASEVETVTISNAGGAVPLTIHTVAITGANAGDYHIVKNNCPTDLAPADIPIDGSCTVDVAFSASAPGARSAALTITSNAPGASQSAALSGTGVTANPVVSAALDPRNGFPAYMQDGNANRVQPCLEATSKCVLLPDAGFNPASPVVFPTNFPNEFFYSIAETPPVSTPGCPAAGVGSGAIIMRVAIEGGFVNGTPIAGDQTTFGRVRISGSGLCPSTPYTFVTPWGPTTVSTDVDGGIKPKAGTTDNAAVLTFPMINGFPRWNPNVAPAAPVGYLGDFGVAHTITGGTYVPAGASGVDNAFTIKDSAGNQIARTTDFFVSGKLAGPLQGSTYSFDFGNANVGTTSANRTVTITNVGAATTISARALAGLNAADYVINGGTCTVGLALATDQTCTVLVAFRPTAVGTRAAQLRITPAAGADIVVTLTGVGNAVGTPAITATPGTLAFGTRNAGTSTTLTSVVRNSGTANLVVSATGLSGLQAADYSIVAAAATPCPAVRPFTLTPGQSCTLAVAFSPKGSGTRSGTLVITHNASAGATNVSLSGTGVVSSFAVGAVKFGTVALNTTKTSTVSVRNSGALAARITSASFTGPQAAFFSVVNGGTCVNATIATGKSCSLTISVRPTAAGNYSATLNVFGDATTVPSPAQAVMTATGK